MTKDMKTGECFRLDHLIKAHLEKIGADKKTPPEIKAECEDIVIKVPAFLFQNCCIGQILYLIFTNHLINYLTPLYKHMQELHYLYFYYS